MDKTISSYSKLERKYEQLFEEENYTFQLPVSSVDLTWEQTVNELTVCHIDADPVVGAPYGFWFLWGTQSSKTVMSPEVATDCVEFGVMT